MKVYCCLINAQAETRKRAGELGSAYCRAYDVPYVHEHWTPKRAETLLGYFYAAQPDLFFVAKVKDTVVGAIVALVKPWWDGTRLTDGEFFVDPRYQKQGIGQELLRTLFHVAQDKYRATAWDSFTFATEVKGAPLPWYKKRGITQNSGWTMITCDIDKVLKQLEQPKTDH